MSAADLVNPLDREQNLEGNLDCEGFLADKNFWTPEIARILARAAEIGEIVLNEDQWNVIHFVRGYYEVFGQGPPIVKVAKHTGLSLKQICEIFPCGLVKGAYRLAGLPRPPGCA